MKLSIGAGIVVQLILGLLFLYSLTHDGSIKQSLLLLAGIVLVYFSTLMMASLAQYRQANSGNETEVSSL